MKKKVSICLTFDVDEDAKSSFDNFSWQGIEKGIPLILSVLDDVFNDVKKAYTTWFVRCDPPLNMIYGSYSYLFERYQDVWNNLVDLKHEIGWHGHIYKMSENNWVQETDDNMVNTQILNSLKSMTKAFKRPNVTRLGGLFGSNKCIETLDEYGIIADCSALPGRKVKNDKNVFDWLKSPLEPFNPSYNNYSIPGKNSYKTLEIPLSISKFKFPYDKMPFKRYIDLTYNENIFSQFLNHYKKNISSLITISHPDKVIKPEFSENDVIYDYSIECFKKNLISLLSILEQNNVEYNLITISDLVNKSHKWKK